MIFSSDEVNTAWDHYRERITYRVFSLRASAQKAVASVQRSGRNTH
jgi:hypothetical protein